jgi:tetratricopeptide (TPR) repeat protein
MTLLFLWGGMDQVHFALGTDEGNLSSLRRAAVLNPYDSLLQGRIALAEASQGQKQQAIAALEQAVAINPYNLSLQQACARALIENGLFAEAYDHYAKMLEIFPNDPDALVNYGLLAARLGHPDVAIDSWERASQADPSQPNPHLYLAQGFEQKGEWAAAARNWEAFLKSAQTRPDDPIAGLGQQISARIQLADDQSRLGDARAASANYQSAIALALHSSDPKLGSLALARFADLEEKSGDVKSAAKSFQQGLALDEKAADPQGAASDWFNYGQFLRRHGLPEELAYACLLHAEELMAGTNGGDFETVKSVREQVERQLGKRALAIKADLPAALKRAAELPSDSF